MRTCRLFVLGILFCLFVGCSPRDFLTRRLASSLISGTETFKNPQIFWLKSGIVSNKDFNSPESLVLQRRGWIIGTPAECAPGVEPPPCWDVVLSPIGVDVFRPLIPDSMRSMKLISVRVARRELVEVTGISKAGNFADVDFTWHWVSTNEVGSALYDAGVRYRSTVGFRKYDDGWRVLSGTTRSNQAIEDALRNAEASP